MTRFTGLSVANSILRIKKFNAILRPLRPRHTTLELSGRFYLQVVIRFPPVVHLVIYALRIYEIRIVVFPACYRGRCGRRPDRKSVV